MTDFQIYLQSLSEYGLPPIVMVIFALLSFMSGLVVMIVQLKKFKIQSNQAKENNLKYRTENYQSAKGYQTPAQTFKRIVPVYELDERTNNLVVVGTKDIQDLVQSSRDCGLDIVLEKYGVLPDMVVHGGKEAYEQACKSDKVDFDMTDIRDDLSVLADFSDEIENMRVRYNMPMASYDDLQKHISKLQLETQKKIQETISKQSEVKKDEIS